MKNGCLPATAVCLAAAASVLMSAAGGAAAEEKVDHREFPMMKVAPKIPLKARPFNLKHVRLLDGPFHRAMERTRKYLHALESERLLHFFRKTAGLEAPGKPMGGWETAEVRGHTMGHYLSACALMAASTGDKKLKAKAERIVAELAKCQKALGGGYLSAYPESFIDRVIARKRVWAPWYTLHKIYAGLIDMYVHCGSAQALEVAQGMAAWAKGRLDPLDEAAMQGMLNTTEQGGMNEALANLYGLTGDERWLALSRRFVQKRYVEPLARGEDRLKGEHVNSFIPNIIGTARQYELTGEPGDRKIAEFFWNQVTGARCYCTGGTSNDEHWRSDPGKLADQLGDHTQETCCTYNMLKLTRHVFTWTADAQCADYYERALINSILATQDPATGMMMYFVPLAPGRWKYFNLPREAFWCCTGTGMENHAKYGDSIYFHDDGGVFVNLFIASELTWEAKGVRIRQETNFPRQEGTSLIVRAEKPVEFELRVRVPGWTGQALTTEVGFELRMPGRFVTAKLNGKPIKIDARPGTYAIIRRTWKDGDRLDVRLPMALWAWPMPDDKTLVAVMYGPLVLAGRLGAEGLTKALTYTSRNWFAFPKDEIASAPTIVTDDPNLAAWIKPVEGKPLTFRTAGVGRPEDVTLVPYHMLFNERYAVYWRVVGEQKWRAMEAERKARRAKADARRRELARRLVDEVKIGDSASEREHGLKQERSSAGVHLGRRWRHAPGGGWFSYEMKVLPDRAMTLLCTYWGSDVGPRTFDVLLDGQKIATQTLRLSKPGEFFDVEYPIPPKLTRDKQKVTVKFQAASGKIAGGVFGCVMLKAKE